MKRAVFLIFVLLFAVLSTGCSGADKKTAPAGTEKSDVSVATPIPSQESIPDRAETGETEEVKMEKELHLAVNDVELSVDWEINESVDALIDLVSSGPLTVKMSMYGGFEQVGALGTSLPRSDSQTTTRAGDIVLYSGNQIVVFYGSNSWAYTRLGRIADKTEAELAELLGSSDVTITLTWK